MKLFNWVLELKILSAKRVRYVAIDANKHLWRLVTNRSTQVIGRATKKWIICISLNVGVEHWSWANNRGLVFIDWNLRTFVLTLPPPVTLSPPTTRSTNGGSAGSKLSPLIGDKVFSATVAMACKCNFSVLRWLTLFTRLTEEGVNGAEPCCTRDGMLGAQDLSTTSNWADDSLPRLAARSEVPAPAEEEGRGSWADMMLSTINEGNERGYLRTTCFGN